MQLKSIPASQIVNVIPAVLVAGGEALQMNGVLITYATQMSEDELLEFTSSEAVGKKFGYDANEYKFASVYFMGFTNSTSKPKTLIMYKPTAEATPSEIMGAVTVKTLNFATFTTAAEPDLEIKKAYADWNTAQNNRYMYVCHGKEENAITSAGSGTMGEYLANTEDSGTCLIYGDIKKAGFIMGTTASINFQEQNGRITFKFKRQDGLEPDITNAEEANYLEKNGYNFYGAWATANDRFIFLSGGTVSGSFKWIDTYINQIYLNSQLQLALMTMLTTLKSVPYNYLGVALHRSACQDPINEALNFGAIRAGVELSELQKADINSQCGYDAATQIEQTGYHLYIGTPTAQTRAMRGSYPIKLFYTDGGSVHSVEMSSIAVQ